MKEIAALLHRDAPTEELERAVVNAVNYRFYGKDVPDNIVKVKHKETAVILNDHRHNKQPQQLEGRRVPELEPQSESESKSKSEPVH